MILPPAPFILTPLAVLSFAKAAVTFSRLLTAKMLLANVLKVHELLASYTSYNDVYLLVWYRTEYTDRHETIMHKTHNPSDCFC